MLRVPPAACVQSPKKEVRPMAMGKRRQRQETVFILAEGLPKSAGYLFYERLNALLTEADFDRWIEKRCQRYYNHESV
jgi:hypothetical protein